MIRSLDFIFIGTEKALMALNKGQVLLSEILQSVSSLISSQFTPIFLAALGHGLSVDA